MALIVTLTSIDFRRAKNPYRKFVSHLETFDQSRSEDSHTSALSILESWFDDMQNGLHDLPCSAKLCTLLFMAAIIHDRIPA